MATPCYAINKSAFLLFLEFYILSFSLLIHAQQWYDYYDDDLNEAPVHISTPEECARKCQDGEAPKYCYYTFDVEFYTTVGPACDRKSEQVQCVVADGVEKTLTTINRQLPGPAIELCNGDYLIVDVLNGCSGLGITVHWHGIFQNGYQYYDGVPYVTQCPIPSSTTFRYQFRLENSGTHFYHSHISTHMLDGQYGSLIVRDSPSADPHYELYDEDNHTIFLSDWIHELSLEKFPGHYHFNLGQAAQNVLINGRGNWTDPDTKQTTNASLTVFTVSSGKRYRFRIINSFSTVCLAELSFEGHSCTLIAQDGANVKPKVVNSLISSSGERADCIINANQSARSYWIHVRGLGECEDKKVQQLAILKYDNAPIPPPTPAPTYDDVPTGVVYNPLDATSCTTQNTEKSVCVNQLESLDDESDFVEAVPDDWNIIPFYFFNYTTLNDTTLFKPNTYKEFFTANDRSQLISLMNDVAFHSPSSPLISQANGYKTVCTPNQPSQCNEPCTCSQVISVQLNSIVEFFIYDEVPLEGLHHPFHLHGYEFKVMAVGQFRGNKSRITQEDLDEALDEYRQRRELGEFVNPPGKDTVKIPQGGYAIIRFKANNPGWWLLHCHFTWHHITGMELVVHVGERSDLPPVPVGFPKCNNWRPPLQSLNDFYGYSYL